MLNINKNESDNFFNIIGVLNEISDKTGTSAAKNDKYISLTLNVRVDQEVNGSMTENIIPVSLFAMRHKSDGKELNTNYDRIMEYKDKLVSLGTVEKGSEHLASKVSITGKIRENSFMSKTGQLVNSWNIDTNFVNDQRATDEEGATFRATGVVCKKFRETDSNGDETGKLIVKICIVGYAGKANVIEFCAYGSKADYIDEHWNKGDTVKFAGYIAVTNKVIEVQEDMGFGDPITHKKTESKRELVIDRGSREGLDEADSYDADDIKLALQKRDAELKKLAEGSKKPKAKKSDDFDNF